MENEKSSYFNFYVLYWGYFIFFNLRCFQMLDLFGPSILDYWGQSLLVWRSNQDSQKQKWQNSVSFYRFLFIYLLQYGLILAISYAILKWVWSNSSVPRFPSCAYHLMLAILQLFGISEVTQLEDFCFFLLEMIGKCGNRNSIFFVGNFSWNMRTLDLSTSFLIFPFFLFEEVGLVLVIIYAVLEWVSSQVSRLSVLRVSSVAIQ